MDGGSFPERGDVGGVLLLGQFHLGSPREFPLQTSYGPLAAQSLTLWVCQFGAGHYRELIHEDGSGSGTLWAQRASLQPEDRWVSCWPPWTKATMIVIVGEDLQVLTQRLCPHSSLVLALVTWPPGGLRFCLCVLLSPHLWSMSIAGLKRKT